MSSDTIDARTRLQRDLARMRSGDNGRRLARPVMPIDAFNLALRTWKNGERVELTHLSNELGVGRATLYRWVGSRELLLGEVLWYLSEKLWDNVAKNTQGVGATYIANACGGIMEGILATEPLRQFLTRDPEYALRILTSKKSVVQSRSVARTAEELAKQKASGYIDPEIDIENLAYLIVRIIESCIYSDQIAGRKPDTEIACKAIHTLVSA